MGGSDDAVNLVELTVPEHAEAHKELYEKCGKLEDYIAWKSLSKQIDKIEIAKLMYKLAGKRSSEAKIRMRDEPNMIRFRQNRSKQYSGAGNPMFGSNRTGKDAPNLRYIIVTPTGHYHGLGDAIKANPGIPIRKWCLSRTDVPFTQYKKSLAARYSKDEVIGKTPRQLGYYFIQYDNQQPSS